MKRSALVRARYAHLRNACAYLGDIYDRESAQRERRDHDNVEYALLYQSVDQPHDRRRSEDYGKVCELLSGGEAHSVFVLEGVADESEILAEKHVVDYDDTAEHPCRLFDIAPRALVSQRIEYPEPYDEGSHRKAAGGYEVPYGIAHIAGNYEFLRGCRNDRRGDDKSGQHGKENRAAEEHLRMIDVLVRLFFYGFCL